MSKNRFAKNTIKVSIIKIYNEIVKIELQHNTEIIWQQIYENKICNHIIFENYLNMTNI